MSTVEQNRAAVKRHYDTHKQYYLERNAKLRKKKTEYLIKLREQPCKDCGNKFPYYVMEFDHLHDKVEPVTRLVSSSWKKLKTEIDKCEIVCANCHAIRTWKRRHG